MSCTTDQLTAILKTINVEREFDFNFGNYSDRLKYLQISRGPRDYQDMKLLDIFGKSVPIGNFKKWY